LAARRRPSRRPLAGRAPPEFVDLPDPREVVRPLLSDGQIASVWEEGRAMSLDEAASYARASDAAS
jgi:hypothetical protein